MIVRELKLHLTYKQEVTLNTWLFRLTGVYNWASRTIKLNAENRIYFSKMDFQNKLAGTTSKKIKVPSHVIQATLTQAHTTWQRCFEKVSGQPRLKGCRNPLTSIPFSDPIKAPVDNHIKLLGIGRIRFYKQDLPNGKIKCGRIVKRASGWYLCLFIDAAHTFDVQPSTEEVGIDFGFSTLATLSDGNKIANPRELCLRADRLAQAQRGRNKKLTARLHEKTKLIRRDRNHKISRRLLERYGTVYYSEDSLRAMSSRFGKSITEASIGNLIQLLNYKAQLLADRNVVAVNSFNSTKTCSTCRALTGPSGLNQLDVRMWTCEHCGAHHDRDINAALNTLRLGQGMTSRSHTRQLTEMGTGSTKSLALLSTAN